MKLIFGPAPEAEDQVNETKETDDPRAVVAGVLEESKADDNALCWREP